MVNKEILEKEWNEGFEAGLRSMVIKIANWVDCNGLSEEDDFMEYLEEMVEATK